MAAFRAATLWMAMSLVADFADAFFMAEVVISSRVSYGISGNLDMIASMASAALSYALSRE